MKAIGRYLLQCEVARGGMGAVFRALAPDGGQIAVKLLLPGSMASATARRRFELEVAALLRLDHPNVVRIIDAGLERSGDAEVPWLALAWIEGETLHARLRRTGALPTREAAWLVQKLARALAHCHAQGIVHRDLKPSNVLIRASDREPLLIDFGLVRDLDAAAGPSSTGQLLGTPGYLAPEQALGRPGEIGPATDVWGLGAILFVCLSGRPPYVGASLAELVLAVQHRDPVAPSRYRPGVPRALDAICGACLARDPERRLADAEAVAAALESWLRGDRALRAGAGLLAVAGLAAAGAVGIALAGRGPRVEPVAAVASGAPAAPASARPSELSTAARVASLLELAEGRGEDHAAAAADCERAILLDPDSAMAHLLLGRARCLAGDGAGGIAALGRAIALDPTDARAHRLRGLARRDAGDYASAVKDLDRAIELEPRDVAARFARGSMRTTLGDPAGALIDLEETIALDPDHALAHYHRGVARMVQGDFAAGVADLDRAIALDPTHASAWAHRGTGRAQLGDLEGGLADLSRAIELDPGLERAWLDRAVIRARGKDYAAAEADLDAALRLDPESGQALINRGLVRGRRGDLAGAIADYERFLRQSPEDPQAAGVRKEIERLRQR